MPTALPPASDFTGSSRNEAQGKTFITDLRAFLAGLLGTDGLPATARDTLVLPKANAKNAIIGGDFSTNPWGRGTSFAPTVDTQYTADRWRWGQSGTGVVTVTKSADAPTFAQAGRYSTHCLSADVTTADAAMAAGDVYEIAQRVEGYNFIPLAGGAMAFQFWHKHTKIGTYCVSFSNSGGDRSYIAEYTQAVTDTWELATIIIAASPSAGTWDYTTGVGIAVGFTFAAGSTWQTTANAWQTGNYRSTVNQVNGMDNTANNCRIALVQLEPGNVATSFEGRSRNEEYELAQRYYQVRGGAAAGICDSAGAVGFGLSFSPKMRVAPSAVLIGTTITIRTPGADTASSGSTIVALDSSTDGAFNLVDGWGAALTAGRAAVERYGFGNVAFSAEL